MGEHPAAGSERRPLRIVVDARLTYGIGGGLQQWVIGLAHALSQIEDGDEEYHFLVRDGSHAWLTPFLSGRCQLLVEPTHPPPPVATPVGRDPRRGLRRILAAWFPRIRRAYRTIVGRQPAPTPSSGHRAIAGVRADVMHFTTQTAFTTTVPSIYQPWDLQHLHLPEFFTPSQIEVREKAYRSFCDQASLIVVATNWVRSDLVEQYGIRPDKIAVINPPPVTLAYEAPAPGEEAAIATRLALPEQFLFYPAQTWGHKNHGRLFEALARLRDRGVVIPVVFTGRQDERFPALLERARELGVDGQLRFLGFVDTAEIQVVYRRATALIFPSLYEGWGLPIGEAFAVGLPVCASRVTSLPEFVGDAALLFDPYEPDEIAEAMLRLWTDADLRAQLAARGRARIAQFDWARTARLLRAHYRSVAGRDLEPSDQALLAAAPLV
jgi:glycosyltransferase involved in cell wall biosynthesis